MVLHDSRNDATQRMQNADDANRFCGLGAIGYSLADSCGAGLIAFFQTIDKKRHERFQRFQALLLTIANKDLDMGPKLAAAYELRHYQDYASVLNKIFVDGNVRQDGSDPLARQLKDSLRTMRPD